MHNDNLVYIIRGGGIKFKTEARNERPGPKNYNMWALNLKNYNTFFRNMPGPQKKKKLYLCYHIAGLNKLYMMKLNIFQYNKISFIQPLVLLGHFQCSYQKI